jgi:methionyl-tRNA formyltransferase
VKVLVLTGPRTAGLAQVVLASARQRNPRCAWRLLVMNGDPRGETTLDLEAAEADLLISFLSPHIVTEDHLRAVGGRAYNVHPCTPAHPGTDPMHFAFYAGDYVAGATLHLMEPEVDAGPICAVVEHPVDPGIGLPAFSALCVNLAVGLLLEQLPPLLRGELSPNGRQWEARNRRSHRDFLAMCRVPLDVSAAELSRRLEAFYHPDLPDRPFVELHGRRFVYEGEDGGSG